MNVFILDACALIAVLNKEDGAEPVKDILTQAKIGLVRVYMNKLNLLEVYYGVLREYGNDVAEKILQSVLSSPIEIVDSLADTVFKQAGLFKSRYRISIADSIVLAEGVVRSAIIVTSDHHEFDTIERQEDLKFFWIR